LRPKRTNQFGAMASVGHGPALLSMEANGGLGSNLAARFQSRERREWLLLADRSTSREGLDFDESTAVDQARSQPREQFDPKP